VSDLQEQLNLLRRRVARIDRKYAVTPSTPFSFPRPEPRPVRYFIDEWMSGQQVETPEGKHFETERLFQRHRRHGAIDVSSLEEMPDDLLGPISDGDVTPAAARRWAFLDTETTGLAGGAGTYAFLIGVGRITAEGFRIRQFFMRDHSEEPSVLHALAQHLAEFDVLVTYNGKVYDQPLLETRYRIARARPPFTRMSHFDLLFGARRLWKLRFESCRLVELENQVLGVERDGDLPGEMIPYVYFEYLRTREAVRLVPIFHHNSTDIITLACLTAIVPYAFRSPAEMALRHSAEMVGLARWLARAGQHQEALALFRRAVDSGLNDNLLFRTLWDVAALEKKLNGEPAAIRVLADLGACRNPFRVAALVELAKYYEHRERNYSKALEFTCTAIEMEDTPALRSREARLKRRTSAPANGRLL
jgi:uncharacterized protein YprB with RNaseH-like and TPR domain